MFRRRSIPLGLDSRMFIVAIARKKPVLWLVVAVLLVPSGFFIVTSFFQLQSVLSSINRAPSIYTAEFLANTPTADFDADAYEVRGRVSLDLDNLLHRHQRSQAQLASRTWLRFMSMSFGAILIVIGGTFILGRISVPRAEMDMEAGSVRLSLAASSPGLFLILCGCALVIAPIVTKQTIWTSEGSSYLQRRSTPANADPARTRAADEAWRMHEMQQRTKKGDTDDATR